MSVVPCECEPPGLSSPVRKNCKSASVTVRIVLVLSPLIALGGDTFCMVGTSKRFEIVFVRCNSVDDERRGKRAKLLFTDFAVLKIRVVVRGEGLILA